MRYRGVDYSVPTAYGHRHVVVKGFVDEVVIVAGSEAIARHGRSYEAGDLVLDPLHYLALLEEKPGALDQAAPLRGWELPPAFAEMRGAGSWRRAWAGGARRSSSRCCG